MAKLTRHPSFRELKENRQSISPCQFVTPIEKELKDFVHLVVKHHYPNKQSSDSDFPNYLLPINPAKGRKTDHISIEQYNIDIDEAIEQASKGEHTTLENLEKEMQSW